MPGAAGGATEDKGAEVDGKIKAQGDKVRQLKTDKAEKAEIEAAVKTLLELKAEYKAATGKDWKPPAAGGEKKAEADKVKVTTNLVTFISIIIFKLRREKKTRTLQLRLTEKCPRIRRRRKRRRRRRPTRRPLTTRLSQGRRLVVMTRMRVPMCRLTCKIIKTKTCLTVILTTPRIPGTECSR